MHFICNLLNLPSFEHGPDVGRHKLDGSTGCQRWIQPCSVHVADGCHLTCLTQNWLNGWIDVGVTSRVSVRVYIPLLTRCSPFAVDAYCRNRQGYDRGVQQPTWWQSLSLRFWVSLDTCKAHLAMKPFTTFWDAMLAKSFIMKSFIEINVCIILLKPSSCWNNHASCIQLCFTRGTQLTICVELYYPFRRLFIISSFS